MPILKIYNEDKELILVSQEFQGYKGWGLLTDLLPNTTYEEGTYFVSWEDKDFESEKIPVPRFTTESNTNKELVFYFKDALTVEPMTAYDIAVRNGFTGTELEWVKSIKGEKGDSGLNFTQGGSAYEYALDNGFEGTVDEWLESLKGIPGDKGDKGDKGDSLKYTELSQAEKKDLKSNITDQAVTDFVLEDESISENKLMDESVTPDKTSFIATSSNLLNKYDITKGKQLDVDTGNLIDLAPVSVFNKWLEVKPGDVFTSNGLNTRCYYTKDKTFISGKAGNGTFTIPENAYYMRNSTTNITDPQLNKGDTLKPYEDWYKPTLQGVNVEEEEEDKEKINHFALDDHLNLDYTPPTITGIGLNDPLTFEQIAYTDYYTYYDELMANNPDYISKTLAGTDKDGNEIYRYDFKPERPKYDKDTEEIERDFDKPKIFLVSSTHGNERTVIWALYNTMKLICEQWQDDEALEFLRWNAHFIVIPIINPSGYSKFTRVNSNGVDLNRNFASSWVNGNSDPSLLTYRGTEPLSEPEAVICDNIMKNEDLTFVIDYHNFHVPSESSFNWIIGSSPFVNAISEQLLSKMARKWKKINPDIPQDSRFFGHVSPMINVGNLSNHAVKEYGISSALFEVCRVFYDKPGTEKLDSFISTIATDSVINYLILILKNANKL